MSSVNTFLTNNAKNTDTIGIGSIFTFLVIAVGICLFIIGIYLWCTSDNVSENSEEEESSRMHRALERIGVLKALKFLELTPKKAIGISICAVGIGCLVGISIILFSPSNLDTVNSASDIAVNQKENVSVLIDKAADIPKNLDISHAPPEIKDLLNHSIHPRDIEVTATTPIYLYDYVSDDSPYKTAAIYENTIETAVFKITGNESWVVPILPGVLQALEKQINNPLFSAIVQHHPLY
ncbi:hypothetical protein NEOKW01_0919 [Nematocida sp. AWRm80]|nr:hypothetical protein NEOKW01_0919 [Nematocida sp. AWRm80]